MLLAVFGVQQSYPQAETFCLLNDNFINLINSQHSIISSTTHVEAEIKKNETRHLTKSGSKAKTRC